MAASRMVVGGILNSDPLAFRGRPIPPPAALALVGGSLADWTAEDLSEVGAAFLPVEPLLLPEPQRQQETTRFEQGWKYTGRGAEVAPLVPAFRERAGDH